MEPRDIQHEQPALEYDGYQGNQASSISPGSSPQGDVYGDYRGSQEKLQSGKGGSVSEGRRLALAIVSVVLLVWLAVIILYSQASSFGSYVILGIVALAVFLINVLFYR